MTALADAVTQLGTDNDALKGEIDQAIAVVQGLPEAITLAVQKALADAGVDDAAATAALAAMDQSVKDEANKLALALVPSVPEEPAPEPTPAPAPPADSSNPAAAPDPNAQSGGPPADTFESTDQPAAGIAGAPLP